MPVRIITIPFDRDKEIFDDEVLSDFMATKQVRSLQPKFFCLGDHAYWTVFLEYDLIMDPHERGEKPALPSLDPVQQMLFTLPSIGVTNF
jgi:hypothetical protein